MIRVRSVFVAVALVLSTAACADVVTGSGSAPGDANDPSSGGRSVSAPSTPSTPPAPPAPSQPIPAGPEFSTIRYALPSGFSATSGFVPAVPLEQASARRYYVTPSGHTDGAAGVISVVVYDLASGVNVSTAKAQVARIGYYNRLLKVKVTKALAPTRLAGRAAYTESVIEPPNYVYSTWFVFGTTHVLQFTCQFGAAATDAMLTTGCDQLRQTLQTN